MFFKSWTDISSVESRMLNIFTSLPEEKEVGVCCLLDYLTTGTVNDGKETPRSCYNYIHILAIKMSRPGVADFRRTRVCF